MQISKPITIMVYGSELHAYQGRPEEFEIPFNPEHDETVSVNIGGDRYLEYWLVGLKQHPQAAKFVQHLLPLISTDRMKLAAENPSLVGLWSRLTSIKWVAIAPNHHIISLDDPVLDEL